MAGAGPAISAFVYLLENTVQRYAWGSRRALAELTGRPAPTTEPEAELWLGAHPLAPSRAVVGAEHVPLDALVARAPAQALGAATVAAHGERLPFLLKVLAAERPLSLQAHPTRAQAEEGFDREEARGVPLTAPHRCYRDRNHKPELVCALTPFEALCGFRAPRDTLALFELLDVASLTPLLPLLRGDEGLRRFFERLMTLEAPERLRLTEGVADACRRRPPRAFEGECAWAATLHEAYPGDAGVVGALLLNLVRLGPGDALALAAGKLHAYLRGVSIELMASSDNVLRGGLTPKHVDVPELLRVLDFGHESPQVLRPRGAPEGVYSTPSSELRLSRIDLEGVLRLERWSADLLLVAEGAATLELETTPTPQDRAGAGPAPLAPPGLALVKGASAFVPFSDGPLRLRGRAQVFRATCWAPESAR